MVLLLLALGGGKETLTLHIKEKKTGKEWILRAVDKLPLGALPQEFRGTIPHLILSGNLILHHILMRRLQFLIWQRH